MTENENDPTAYLFLFIALAGLVTIVVASFQAWRGLRAKSWDKTQGLVLEYLYSGTADAPTVLKVVQPLSAPSNEIHIRYEYLYRGEWFRGWRIYFGKRATGNKKKAYSYLKRFPAGSAIEVYVNPSRPAESVLLPGIGYSVTHLFILGLIMLVVGGYLARLTLQAA